jgi:mRNA-degrading endonuclease RelE of RelBE toxin-antitoxin system
MYSIFVSRTFEKQFHSLTMDVQRRIRLALNALQEDPINPRAGADIRALTDTNPRKYRLRVGSYRIIYTIEKTRNRVIEVFSRGKGYRE